MANISATFKKELAKVKNKTVVKFYVELSGILAVFPNEKAHYNGYRYDNRVCYSHVGQHSMAHPDYFRKLKKATPEQYKDLKEELESMGYNLEIK